MPHINEAVPNAREYYPLNKPDVGRPLKLDSHTPKLFRPITIRGVEFRNRIWVAPMCQYSSSDGHATDWHLVHLGTFTTRGLGSICVEATSVTPEGRISPEDMGIWDDSHIPTLKRIVEFSHAHGTKIGIQLAHAGRKASTLAPWLGDRLGLHGTPKWTAEADENGWPDNVLGPSDSAWAEVYPTPKAITEEQMNGITKAFVDATKRCKEIGFDFVEVHSAHGYLMHQFLSPLSNSRTDQYGGSLENRLRYPISIIKAVREEWNDKPLFVRISAVDWADGPERNADGAWKQWGIEQSKIYVGEMAKLGVDVVDVSTGGNWAKQHIHVYEGFQAQFADAIKKEYPDLIISTVGAITRPEQAEALLWDGKCDVVRMARELLRNPSWVLDAARTLGVKIKDPNQYERAYINMPSR